MLTLRQGGKQVLRDRHAVLRILILSRLIPALGIRAEPTVGAAVGSRESSVIPSSEALHPIDADLRR